MCWFIYALTSPVTMYFDREFSLHITCLHLTYDNRIDQNPSGQTWTTWSCSSPGMDILKSDLSTGKPWKRKSVEPNWELLCSVFGLSDVSDSCFQAGQTCHSLQKFVRLPSSKFRSPKSSTLAPSRRLILSRMMGKNTSRMLEFSCNLLVNWSNSWKLPNIFRERPVTQETLCTKARCQSQPHIRTITKEAHSVLHFVNFLTQKKHNTSSRKTPETCRILVKLSICLVGELCDILSIQTLELSKTVRVSIEATKISPKKQCLRITELPFQRLSVLISSNVRFF